MSGRIQIWMKRIGSSCEALSSEWSAPDPRVMRWTDPAGSGPNGSADVVLMAERALDDVGQALDVPVRMQRPDGAGLQAVVVEDAHRAERVVLWVLVSVEAEVPAGAEPAAVDVVDVGVAPDLDHAAVGSTSSSQLVPTDDADLVAGGDAGVAASPPVLAAHANHALRPALGDRPPAPADQRLGTDLRLPAARPAPGAERLEELEDRGDDHDRDPEGQREHEDRQTDADEQNHRSILRPRAVVGIRGRGGDAGAQTAESGAAFW